MISREDELLWRRRMFLRSFLAKKIVKDVVACKLAQSLDGTLRPE